MSTAAPLSPSTSLPIRTWLVVVIVGMTGQLAWTVENMYLNVFVYDVITTDATVIAVLVAASAATATCATLLIGAASDRVGRRRPFIAVGYVLWGATTATFGLVRPEGGAQAVQGVALAVAAIITLDCVMSFFGSSANDAAFNAWITESTTSANRGRVEGVVAIMPLVSMLVIFGALDPLTRAARWELFFAIIGAVTTIVGVVAWFLVRDPATTRPQRTRYLTTVIYGLRPATMRAHSRLYVLFGAWSVIGISTQVFIPFLIIYIQRYLRIESYAIVLAAVVVAAAVISVLGGRVMDRTGKLRAVVPSVMIMTAGLIGMFFARGMGSLIVAGTAMMGGFMLSFAALGASVRDATPADRVGMVQGLRMIAVMLIPMVIGPFIGSAVIEGANETYVDLGVVKQVPTPWIFIAAAAVAVCAVVPMRLVGRTPASPSATAEPGAAEPGAEEPGAAEPGAAEPVTPEPSGKVAGGDVSIQARSQGADPWQEGR